MAASIILTLTHVAEQRVLKARRSASTAAILRCAAAWIVIRARILGRVPPQRVRRREASAAAVLRCAAATPAENTLKHRLCTPARSRRKHSDALFTERFLPERKESLTTVPAQFVFVHVVTKSLASCLLSPLVCRFQATPTGFSRLQAHHHFHVHHLFCRSHPNYVTTCFVLCSATLSHDARICW